MTSSFLAYRLVQLLLETDFYLLSQILWLKKGFFLVVSCSYVDPAGSLYANLVPMGLIDIGTVLLWPHHHCGFALPTVPSAMVELLKIVPPDCGGRCFGRSPGICGLQLLVRLHTEPGAYCQV